MAVLIKGLNKPHSCGDCWHDANCDRWRNRNWGGPPPDDCPIEAAPTDVVEVRYGEWTEENRRPKSSQFVCSVCHRTAYDPQPTRKNGWTKRCRYAYCPNCGAKMQGGQEE